MHGEGFWDMCGERLGVSSRVCDSRINILLLFTVAIS